MVDKLPFQCPELWIKKLTSCLLPWICISAWTGFLIFIVMKPNQGATFLLSFILYSKACWKVFANKQIISLLKWMHSMSPSIWATVQKVHHQQWIFVLFPTTTNNKAYIYCIIILIPMDPCAHDTIYHIPVSKLVWHYTGMFDLGTLASWGGRLMQLQKLYSFFFFHLVCKRPCHLILKLQG